MKQITSLVDVGTWKDFHLCVFVHHLRPKGLFMALANAETCGAGAVAPILFGGKSEQ